MGKKGKLSTMSRQTYNKLKNQALVLKYIIEGYTVTEAAALVGVNSSSVSRWAKLDPTFNRKYCAAKSLHYKNLISKSLDKLAKGSETLEEKIETLTKNEETGEYIKKSIIKKQVLPSIKALQMLASKYEPNTYKDTDTKEVNITITQRDRALSISERLAILSKDASEGEDIELDSNDYKELGE